MTQRKTDTIEIAAAKAGFSRATGYRLAADPLPTPERRSRGAGAARTRWPISSNPKWCRFSRPARASARSACSRS